MTITLHKNDLPATFTPASSLAVDTETLGLNLNRDRLCLVQISNGDGHAHLVQFDRDYSAPNLRHVLSNPKITKIFHYARFDMAMLQKHFDIDITPVFCTKIASKLVRTYSDKHGLKVNVKELLGIDLNKETQASDWAGELSEAQQAYAAADVLHLHELREKLTVMLKRENRLELADRCFAFLETRVNLDLAGFEGDIFAHE